MFFTDFVHGQLVKLDVPPGTGRRRIHVLTSLITALCVVVQKVLGFGPLRIDFGSLILLVATQGNFSETLGDVKDHRTNVIADIVACHLTLRGNKLNVVHQSTQDGRKVLGENLLGGDAAAVVTILLAFGIVNTTGLHHELGGLGEFLHEGLGVQSFASGQVLAKFHNGIVGMQDALGNGRLSCFGGIKDMASPLLFGRVTLFAAGAGDAAGLLLVGHFDVCM